VTARELAARRQLLAANATLQRVRLAHDAAALRRAGRLPAYAGLAGLALAGAAVAAAWWSRQRHPAPAVSPPTAASVWALRGLTLWRAARALRRLWLADAPPR